MKSVGWFMMIGGMLGSATGCGDPYSRYASAVHTDVDAAMATAFQMTARLQLTVVHNQIPNDSLPVAAGIVSRAARDVRKRATHFAAASPPPDLAEAHAGLSADLSRLADALDAMHAALERCAAGPCQPQLDSLSSQFAFVGEDLRNSTTSVRRLLLRHGVMLR